jgi:hypothetical protein
MIPNRALTLPLISLSLLLSACGADDNKQSVPLTEGSYAVQMVASDYSSSQVATGNILGDHTATQGLLGKSGSGYTLSSYQNTLYHIGQYYIDTISRYDAAATTALNTAIWTYSTNDSGDDSSNTYKLVQNADNNAYLIRYGSSVIWQIDPSASSEENFIKGTIDLSSYNWNGENPNSVPNMVDAVVVNNVLYVVMQRLDSWWSVHTAYVAAIDLDSNEEIDTNTQTDGLKGFPLTINNPSTIIENNGTLYISGRGDYSSDTGGIDAISLSDYSVDNIVNGETFADLNDTDNNIYYHVTDVAITTDGQLYLTANLESGYTTSKTLLFTLNPHSGVNSELEISTLTDGAYSTAKISEIEMDSNNRLWVAISNSDAPALLAIDTDTNSRNGDLVELDMPAQTIVFLSE